MPLSKKRNRDRMRLNRLHEKPVVIVVQPNKHSVIPNRYLLAHLKMCPNYDIDKPGEHYKTCLYVNSVIREGVQPKHLPNCPDGRYRPVDKKGNPIYEW